MARKSDPTQQIIKTAMEILVVVVPLAIEAWKTWKSPAKRTPGPKKGGQS